jgi:hypothetical protein
MIFCGAKHHFSVDLMNDSALQGFETVHELRSFVKERKSGDVATF